VHLPDIDIDCADREEVLRLIKHIPAAQSVDTRAKRHGSGIYVTDIPYNAMSDCAGIDYNAAEHRGYFKVDILNCAVYGLIRDSEHYEEMLAREPDWSLLWTNPSLSSKVVHVGSYYSLLSSMKPDNIIKMAAMISIIRPGKAHLQRKPWDEVLSMVWDGNDSEGYVFRKSHAVSYSMLVALHLNILAESLHSLDHDDRAFF
jgi:hypothetical protein